MLAATVIGISSILPLARMQRLLDTAAPMRSPEEPATGRSTRHRRTPSWRRRHDTVVVITGASSGIGLASAIAAAEAGLTAVATVRAPERATALREAAEKAGRRRRTSMSALDVTDPASIAGCVGPSSTGTAASTRW